MSPKALRIYNSTGLLRPILIEPSNGYRRYSVQQLSTARLITMLRGVDMSLSEIGFVLTDLDKDPRRAIERVACIQRGSKTSTRVVESCFDI